MMNVDTVAILDATRDYQPVKMHQFQNPSINKTLDFAQLNSNDSIYMTLGEHGNEIQVFEQTYFRLKNKINTTDEIVQIKFIFDQKEGKHHVVALNNNSVF